MLIVSSTRGITHVQLLIDSGFRFVEVTCKIEPYCQNRLKNQLSLQSDMTSTGFDIFAMPEWRKMFDPRIATRDAVHALVLASCDVRAAPRQKSLASHWHDLASTNGPRFEKLSESDMLGERSGNSDFVCWSSMARIRILLSKNCCVDGGGSNTW